ncbi:hypothetical protein D770_10155 [Flammeovirgaceae bacterium 311]|nr:hypothetical protein D770_10155 [Flammeovirgaceae bacterium 311]
MFFELLNTDGEVVLINVAKAIAIYPAESRAFEDGFDRPGATFMFEEGNYLEAWGKTVGEILVKLGDSAVKLEG